MKSDVYGFGVVLLEIITGLRVLDPNRPSGQINLIDWAKPSLSDKKKLNKLMDPRLEDEYPPKAAFATAVLILKCIEQDPKCRPDMEEVLRNLEEIGRIKGRPKKQRGHQHRLSSPQHHPSGGGRGGAARHNGKATRSY